MDRKILFASDLDGTLLDKSCKVPSAYAARLQKLQSEGMLFTAATGRHPKSAAVALEGSGLKFSAPAICLNGAVLWDMDRDEPVAAWHIDRSAIEEVWEIVANTPVPIHVTACDIKKKTLTTYYLPWIDPDGKGRGLVYEPSTVPPCIFAPSPTTPDPNMICASYFCPSAVVLPIYEKIRQVKGIRAVCYASTRFSDMYFLEFYAENGGKGVAAREAMKYCSAQKLYVFGDSENDIDLFSLADRSFAPQNAAKAALATADEIIPSNLDGGVVSTIEKILKK